MVVVCTGTVLSFSENQSNKSKKNCSHLILFIYLFINFLLVSSLVQYRIACEMFCWCC